MSNPDPFAIVVRRVNMVPAASHDGTMKQATQVQIMVGSHGPFSALFAPGHDSAEEINTWKQSMKAKVQAVTTG